jgi:hypothetical protein
LLQIGIGKLLENGGYEAAYPLHDGNPNEPEKEGEEPSFVYTLRRHWARFGVWYKRQPLDLIRGYFGEELGKFVVYDVFLSFLLFLNRLCILHHNLRHPLINAHKL